MKAALIIAVFAGLLAGCGPSIPKYNAQKDPPAVYPVAYRTLPPEPVYNGLRWVHLPSPVPGGRELPASDAPAMKPVLRLEVKAVKLEQVAQLLARSASYGSFTASTVADKKVTVNSLGTLDELAQKVAQEAGARVVVDHSLRQLRFLGGVSTGN